MCKKKSWYTKKSNVELVLRPGEYRPISSTGFKRAVRGDCLTVNVMADFFPLHFLPSSCIQEYQGSSVLGQFVTRFLLRETSTQLQSLQSSLDCAMEAVHDQGCTGRRIVKKPEDLPIQRVAKRPGRRIQKNMCLSPTDPYSGMLTTGLFQKRYWK